MYYKGREEAIKDSLQEAHRKLDAMQSYVDKLSGNLTKITDGLHMKGKLEPSNNSEEQIFNTQCKFHEERLIQRSSDRVLQMLRQQQEHEQGQDLHELLVLSKSLS